MVRMAIPIDGWDESGREMVRTVGQTWLGRVWS
jgi:uncharacterized protein YbdZ (MbtH family)